MLSIFMLQSIQFKDQVLNTICSFCVYEEQLGVPMKTLLYLSHNIESKNVFYEVCNRCYNINISGSRTACYRINIDDFNYRMNFTLI